MVTVLKTFAALLVFGLITMAPLPATAQETNVTEYLNRQLLTKPQVKHSRTVEKREKVCQEHCHHGGGEVVCSESCQTVTKSVIEPYEDIARVTSTEVTSTRDLVLDKNKLVTLPERALLAFVSYENCADARLSTTLSLSVSGTKGFSVQKGQTLATTKGASVSLTGTFTGGSLATTLSVSENISLSSSTTESSSTTVNRSLSSTISVEPKRSGRFELLSYETTVEIPFGATVIVDGALEPNESGITMASQLLSEPERTLPFSGVLRITDVSNAVIRTIPASGPLACEGAEHALVVTSPQPLSLPAKSIPTAVWQSFAKPKQLFSTRITGDNHHLMIAGDEGPTIGPPDGVTYEIVSESETAFPTPACGFNDAGVPNIGVFRVETRRYSQYNRGTLIATWTQRVETFKSCWAP